MIKKVEELDTKILTEFTNSERDYVGNENGSVKVPMREICLSETKKSDNLSEDNKPVRVYDTSGPATDPNVELDLEDSFEKRFEPEECGIFIFPAHLDHYVTASHSSEERYSISFNYNLDGKFFGDCNNHLTFEVKT